MALRLGALLCVLCASLMAAPPTMAGAGLGVSIGPPSEYDRAPSLSLLSRAPWEGAAGEAGQCPAADASASLSIDITGPTGVVQMGDVLTYHIVVTNSGGVTLTNVTVRDDLLGLWKNVGNLEPGRSLNLTESLAVTEALLPEDMPLGAESFNLHNVVEASSDQTGPVSDAWDVEVEFRFQAARAVLGLQKSGPLYASPGEQIEYTLRVSNIGDVPLTGVRLSDPCIGFEQEVGALQVQESRTYRVTYTIGEDDLPGPVSNVAKASSNEADPVEARWEVAIYDDLQSPYNPAPVEDRQDCGRADVTAIIYGGWDGMLVRAWVGGTEQEIRVTAPNDQGEQQATWTLYPQEGERWQVQVDADFPPGLDPSGWEIEPLSPTTLTVGCGEKPVVYMQLVSRGGKDPEPTAVPTVSFLPPSGYMSVNLGGRLLGWFALASLGLLPFLWRRHKPR